MQIIQDIPNNQQDIVGHYTNQNFREQLLYLAGKSVSA